MTIGTEIALHRAKVFQAAYAMCKLDDGLKVSTDLLAENMAVVRFPPTQTAYNLHNNHSVDEHFDLAAPRGILLPRRPVLWS